MKSWSQNTSLHRFPRKWKYQKIVYMSLPVCDKPYHVNNGFQQMRAEIKNLWNHVLFVEQLMEWFFFQTFVSKRHVSFISLLTRNCRVHYKVMHLSIFWGRGGGGHTRGFRQKTIPDRREFDKLMESGFRVHRLAGFYIPGLNAPSRLRDRDLDKNGCL